MLLIIKEYNSSFMNVKTKNNFVLYIKKIIDTPKNLKIAFSKRISRKQIRGRSNDKKNLLTNKNIRDYFNPYKSEEKNDKLKTKKKWLYRS